MTAGQKQMLLYLCHVREGKVGFGVVLVLLDNVEKLLLPLHRHFELDVVASIVVKGEGEDEGLCISEVFT